MKNEIKIEEYGLSVRFLIQPDGIVELDQFSSINAEICKKTPEWLREGTARTQPEIFPILDVGITGISSRDRSAFKHNMNGASLDFRYVSHTLVPTYNGKELMITMKTDYDLYAYYHMRFYLDAPVVRVYTILENKGGEELPVEHVSSFIFRDICGDGKLPYYKKTDIYTPFNSWGSEARWKKDDCESLNLCEMAVHGFSMNGYSHNCYAYSGKGSGTSLQYLPMGICHDRETDETYVFQIDHSGQWNIEYASDYHERMAVVLSGPTNLEHGWWINLKPGSKFETVPAAFGVVKGDLSDGIAALTEYRRAIRRLNPDDEKLNVVFNDYMNCLSGDPTYEKEVAIIDKAAEMGCEYYCMDCGWYDKGMWWDRVGEWMESRERFPNGMKAVCDYARSKGMVIGLWLEIEVMGTACEFANKCPDNWFVCRHGKRHVDSKRYLLDFRNPEVYQYCMNVVERLIRDYGVGYFKVDYNVDMMTGSDLDTDSNSGAILEHYRALYRWYSEIFQKHPDLIIENCGSGGQRMDYGMLSLLSLQSTSDQTDYLSNSYIASSVASAVTPEQAGMWVYPYEDDEEHVIYNMVNGMLLRPYMSGMVWKLHDNTMQLLKEGIACYKSIRQDLRSGVPFFPLGFSTVKDSVLAYGVKTEEKIYLSVWTVDTDKAEIFLKTDRQIESVELLYPVGRQCSFSCCNQTLCVQMPQKACARVFVIYLK